MRRVAIFGNGVPPFKIGGMQKFTQCSALELANQGVEVDVYLSGSHGCVSSEHIHRVTFGGCPSISVRVSPSRRQGRWPGHYFRDSLRISEDLLASFRLSGSRPDMIYAHGLMGWAALRARQRGDSVIPPVGVHSHGMEALQRTYTFKDSFAAKIARGPQLEQIRSADFNLSLGGRMNDVLVSAGADPRKIAQAWNGVARSWLAARDRSASPSDRRHFLFVGRNERRKGVPELMKAFRGLPPSLGAQLTLVGPGESGVIRSSDRVSVHGAVRDEERLKGFYRKADCLVVPSLAEGMPTVVLEALACGLPIIASDVGAIRRFVTTDCGWLVPPGDVDALRAAMSEAALADLRAKGAASRRMADGLDWGATTAGFLLDMRRLLAIA